MSLFHTFGPSIAALGLAAAVLGVGLSCALTPAWAETQSCSAAITAVAVSPDRQAGGSNEDKVRTFLVETEDELIDEDNEEDGMSPVEKVKKVQEL